MANLSEEEKDKMFNALYEIKENQHKTNQALFGDETIGLLGVVKDLQSLKNWRNETNMRNNKLVGGIAVVMTLATLAGKYVVAKLLGVKE